MFEGCGILAEAGKVAAFENAERSLASQFALEYHDRRSGVATRRQRNVSEWVGHNCPQSAVPLRSIGACGYID